MFLYCFTAAYHLYTNIPLILSSSWRCKANPETYNPRTNRLAKKHEGDFFMPMPFNQIERFEKLNKVQVNVFLFENKDLVPLRISKLKSRFIMDLLLLSEGTSYHYVLIVDLKSFINFLRKKQSRPRDEICGNCFHMCNSVGSLENHKASCYACEAAAIIFPEEQRKFHRFKNLEVFGSCPWLCILIRNHFLLLLTIAQLPPMLVV